MYQSRMIARFCRVLLSGVAAGAVCAHAAVPASGPFGAEPFGNFEPTKPLVGGGWQVLAGERAKPATLAANSPPPASPAGISQAAVVQVTAPPATGAPAIAGQAAQAPVGSSASLERSWTVSPADANYRVLIEKWAREAGWTAAQWEVDQDVPIDASDAFSGDFKTAVRRVLSATEMTDYSLKPCFYSNNYVRVVKLTTKCDPSK